MVGEILRCSIYAYGSSPSDGRVVLDDDGAVRETVYFDLGTRDIIPERTVAETGTRLNR